MSLVNAQNAAEKCALCHHQETNQAFGHKIKTEKLIKYSLSSPSWQLSSKLPSVLCEQTKQGICECAMLSREWSSCISDVSSRVKCQRYDIWTTGIGHIWAQWWSTWTCCPVHFVLGSRSICEDFKWSQVLKLNQAELPYMSMIASLSSLSFFCCFTV